METINKYLNDIAILTKKYERKKIKTPEGDIKYLNITKNGTIYFRGQSNSKWDLVPTLFRHKFEKNKNFKIISNEDEIIYKDESDCIMEYIKEFIPNHEFNDLNNSDYILKVIMELRHYGIPTRILDWTKNPLISLFFSCFDNIEQDGKIFIYLAEDNFELIRSKFKNLFIKISLIKDLFELDKLIENFFADFRYNPFEGKESILDEKICENLKSITTSEHILEFFRENLTKDNKKRFLPFFIENLITPIFIEPNRINTNKRIFFQQSVFSIHFGKYFYENKSKMIYESYRYNYLIGTDDNPLFDEIIIDKNDKKKVILELRKYFGIDEGYIYPDNKDKVLKSLLTY